MEQKTPLEMLTAAECADRTGLTVRALRLYERHGLIAPYRTHKNWRLYGAKDIERLSEIIILKGFGLSLQRIARLLAGKETNLDDVLAVQAEALARQRSRIDQSLATIAGVRSELVHGAASVSILIQLAKEITMTQTATDQAAWKLYEQARPRTEIALDKTVLKEYAGFYRLDDGIIVTIEPGENSIEIALTGQPFVPLYPEARDKFFAKRMPLQFTFDRGADGAVCGLVLHQAGHEMAATRISAHEAQATNATLAERIAQKTPFPASEATLRTLIAEAQSGNVDETRLTPELAKAVREQSKTVAREMSKMGALKALTFKGVAHDGWDVYDAEFENGQQQWRLYMDADGKVSGLFFRPGP